MIRAAGGSIKAQALPLGLEAGAVENLGVDDAVGAAALREAGLIEGKALGSAGDVRKTATLVVDEDVEGARRLRLFGHGSP